MVQGVVSIRDIQPRPTKSSFNDGNYWGGTENTTIIQIVTVQFDPTHSHHLINGLRFSLEFEVGQRDQIVTCDRADSPLTPNDRVPNGRSVQSF